MSLRHALDDDAPVGAELDVGAHPLQEQRELDDLRLGGRVAQHGLALGEDRGQQHGLGRADARVGQRDARAVQPGRLGGDPGRPVGDLGAEGLERVDVEVDRPPPDGVAADQRDERLAGQVQQRAEHQDRDAVEAGEGLGDSRSYLAPGGDRDLAVLPADVEAGRLQHRRRDVHVAHLRGVADDAGAVAQHRCHHVLGHGILGAAHGDVPAQRPRWFNYPRLRHAVHDMCHPANEFRLPKNATAHDSGEPSLGVF